MRKSPMPLKLQGCKGTQREGFLKTERKEQAQRIKMCIFIYGYKQTNKQNPKVNHWNFNMEEKHLTATMYKK